MGATTSLGTNRVGMSAAGVNGYGVNVRSVGTCACGSGYRKGAASCASVIKVPVVRIELVMSDRN